MTKTTLEQLAEKAQVSISTVSRVLNGKKGVNEGTRRRVLSILKGPTTERPMRWPPRAPIASSGCWCRRPRSTGGSHSNFIREGLQAVTDIGRQSNYITMVGAFSPGFRRPRRRPHDPGSRVRRRSAVSHARRRTGFQAVSRSQYSLYCRESAAAGNGHPLCRRRPLRGEPASHGLFVAERLPAHRDPVGRHALH